jgi:hypothetical protein
MKWEYRIMVKPYLDVDALTTRLALRGDMGWELIAVDDKYCYFKRPILPEEQKP